MSVIFANAVLWPFALLLAAPVIIHLFARSRPPVYRFSSVELILRIKRHTMRIKRPQDWLLLVIRTLLFAALIALFLRPVFFASRRLAGPFRKKNVVLVVDATASMAYAEGGQTRFAAACGEASEMLSGLSGRDTANVVWITSTPEAVFPELGVNLSYLQSALKRARVTSGAGNIEEAVRIGVEQLSGAEGRREICIISDFQRSAWESVSPSVPEEISLVKVTVGGGGAANVALTDIAVTPTRPLVGEPLTVHCEVANFSPEPARRTVYLAVGEARESQDVLIPAWGRGKAVFSHVFPEAGVFPLSAALGDDVFAMDDRRWRLIRVAEFLRAGVAADNRAGGEVWQRALNALDWIRTEPVTMAELAGDREWDVLVLAGWNGEALGAVRSRAASGATVFCQPGRSLTVQSLASFVGNEAPASDGETDVIPWTESDEAQRARVALPGDPAFRIFRDGSHGDPARAVFRGRYLLRREALSGAEVLMAYRDDVPALVRVSAGGHAYVWNMALDTRFGNLALQTEFVPFVAELILSGRSDDAADLDRRMHLPGEPVVWQSDRGIALDSVRLRAEDGAEIPVRRQRMGSSLGVIAEHVADLGLYTWEYRSEVLDYSVVNFPVIESDLRPMPAQAAAAGVGVALEGGAVKRLRDGMKLWPFLLALAVVLTVVEGGVLLWTERT